MSTLHDTRRYLTNFDSTRTGNVLTDVLVIGTGVAGARAALEAAKHGQVIMLCKTAFEESSTNWAQGGVAAALDPEDSPDRHLDDTLRVGCGVNRRAAVELLVREGPERVEELLDWGMAVDKDDEGIALTREGGHSIERVVHALGDQTGRALVDTLRQQIAQSDAIRVFEHCYMIDLITLDGQCLGAVTYHERYGHQLIWAQQTILASGGCGRLWRETTNPRVATGDGIAAAFRAGATLADMEMVQFHPTTLYIAGASRALISEAVRGEGAYLLDRQGKRFMLEYHPDAELAPRDVVSRAIRQHLHETRDNCVYLNVRHVPNFTKRFPHITELCAEFQIDVTQDLIPVRPSAHYMIGGVLTDLTARTNIGGLYACGEAACTGVHGANRIASNSLLEGLVFGRIAGAQAGGELAHQNGSPLPVRKIVSEIPASSRTVLDLQDIHNSLRSLMWHNVGIRRMKERLVETCDILAFWGHYTLDKTFDEPDGWEIQNKLTVARLIALSALTRTDSIGVHLRADGNVEEVVRPYHLHITRDPAGTLPMAVLHETPSS
jgi:L-aspartate oxidase